MHRCRSSCHHYCHTATVFVSIMTLCYLPVSFALVLFVISVAAASPASGFVSLWNMRLINRRHQHRHHSLACTLKTAKLLMMNAYKPPYPNFCANCGAAEMKLNIPPGDECLRATCSNCGYVEYQNPKLVVACVVMTEDKQILLAR